MVDFNSSISTSSKENKKKSKTRIDKEGYYRFIDSNKLVHRWIVEKHYNIKLKPSQIIHHKNGNKRDNRIENLEIILDESAEEIHKRKHIEKGYSDKYHNKKQCPYCNNWVDDLAIACDRCGNCLEPHQI